MGDARGHTPHQMFSNSPQRQEQRTKSHNSHREIWHYRRRLTNVVLLLGQRRRRWPNIKTTLAQYLVSAVIYAIGLIPLTLAQGSVEMPLVSQGLKIRQSGQIAN